MHQAVRLGRPLVERIVTVNGGAVAQPGNVFAPIGTLVSDLLDFCRPQGRTGAHSSWAGR